MRIAIIGTGNVGTAIARGLAGKGHDLLLGTRDPAAPDTTALATEVGATATTQAQAAAAADILLLALPWAAAETAIAALGPLDGKIVIDCMNPLGRTDAGLGLLIGHTTSGGETVQTWLPKARVVKSLNQVGAEVMANTARLSYRPVMFMAGNDDTAKSAVATLLADLGFEPLDAGDITKARLLEPFGMLWINQAILRGKGRDWAFAALS